MKGSGAWSPHTLGKYALLQLPGVLLLCALLLLLLEWMDLPLWILWAVLGVWLLKDLILYPLVWRAYVPEDPPLPMVGLYGEARQRIDPQGYVRVRGELWRGELAPGAAPIEPGEALRVCDQRGLTLVVEGTKEEPGEMRGQ